MDGGVTGTIPCPTSSAVEEGWGGKGTKEGGGSPAQGACCLQRKKWAGRPCEKKWTREAARVTRGKARGTWVIQGVARIRGST